MMAGIQNYCMIPNFRGYSLHQKYLLWDNKNIHEVLFKVVHVCLFELFRFDFHILIDIMHILKTC